MFKNIIKRTTELFRYEPVVITNVITGLVTAFIVLFIAFGVPITEEQKAAILTLVSGLALVIATYVARDKVTPMAKLEDKNIKDEHE